MYFAYFLSHGTSHKTLGHYIIRRGKWYNFKRRVPSEYEEFFKQTHIQSPLNTDSEDTAKDRAKAFSRMLDNYWADIALNGKDTDLVRFKRAVKKLKMRGFKYRPYGKIISDVSPHEFVNRIEIASAAQDLRLQRTEWWI